MKNNKLIALFITAVMLFSVFSALGLTASAVELPSNAIEFNSLGYWHDSSAIALVAGDGETLAEIGKRGHDPEVEGKVRDFNYFYVIVVDANGFVAGYYDKLGTTDGLKSDVICPVGGYVIAYNGAIANATTFIPSLNIQLGDVVTLYNVDPDDARELQGHESLDGAGFTIAKPVPAEGYTRVNAATGTFQGRAVLNETGASFDYRIFSTEDGYLVFDYIVYSELQFKELSSDQVGASNMRIWLDPNNAGGSGADRGFVDIFYNDGTFEVHRLVNDPDGSSAMVAEEIKIRHVDNGDSFRLLVAFPISAFTFDPAGEIAYSSTYSSPYLKTVAASTGEPGAYGCIHEAVYNWADNSGNPPWNSVAGYTRTAVAAIPVDVFEEPVIPETSEEPSVQPDTSAEPTTPESGDVGYIALVVIAIVSIAGAFIAKKSR